MKLDKTVSVTITLESHDEVEQLLAMLNKAREWRLANNALAWPIEGALRALLGSV